MQNLIELLGMPAKDKVTGFSGTLTSISFDLYGCIQFVITPDSNDGVMKDGHWFDVNRIELTPGSHRKMPFPDFNNNYSLTYDKGPADKPLK